MKKYLFLMMLSILTVTKANAAEQVLWEGDYNVSWELSDGDEHKEWKGLGKDDFAAMEVGQKLYFYFSVTDDSYHKYNFDNWSWQALPGHEAEHADDFGFSEDTKVEFELTQAIKDEIAANGFAIHGHGFHVTKVSKEVAGNDNPADSEEVLWEGDYNVSWALPDGDEHREWKGLGKDDFAAMEVGQKLYFYFSVTGDSYHKYNFDNWSWQALPGHEAEHAENFGFSEDTKVEFELTQAIKDEIAANGFAIHGHGFHVTKVSVANATVSGTLASSGYTSLSSSYALNLSAITGATAYKVSSITASTVTLTEVTEAVAASTGLILKGEAGAAYSIPVAASGTDISATNKLRAAVTATPLDDGTFYILKDGKFCLVTGAADEAARTVPAGKAYLMKSDVPAGARALSLAIDGKIVTGIETVRNGQQIGEFYNLSGQRVTAPQNGLYIVDGRKVIVK